MTLPIHGLPMVPGSLSATTGTLAPVYTFGTGETR